MFTADNRVKAPRKSHVKDFSIFNQPDEQNYPRLSPQLALATFQYLSTCMLFFYSDWGPIYKKNVRTNLRKLTIKTNLGNLRMIL